MCSTRVRCPVINRLLMYIVYLLILVGIIDGSNSDLNAESEAISLPRDRLLSGGQSSGYDLPRLFLTGQEVVPVNPVVDAQITLQTLIWAVTSLLENNTALAVGDRDNEDERIMKRDLNQKIILKINPYQTKQRGTDERPTLLIPENELDYFPFRINPQTRNINTTGVSVSYAKLRADHILEYSAHAVCFCEEEEESVSVRDDDEDDEKNDKIKFEIYLREMETKLCQRLIAMKAFNQRREISIEGCYPKEINRSYATLRADHILEYTAHAVWLRGDENDRSNEERNVLKIYQRELETRPYQVSGTLIEYFDNNGLDLLRLANSEAMLSNKLRADQWRHSALAVCFLFNGEEIVVKPQIRRQIIIFDTNHRGYEVIYTLIRELVLWHCKESLLAQSSLTRCQKRKKLRSKLYQSLVYQERKKIIASILFRISLALYHLVLIMKPRYLIATSAYRVAKLLISNAMINLEICVIQVIILLIECEEEEKEIRTDYQIFVRNIDGKTMILNVEGDDTTQEIIEEIEKRNTNFSSQLRINKGPKPLISHLTLRDQNIQPGDTLELQLSLLGGVKTRAELLAQQRVLAEQNERIQRELEESEAHEIAEREKAEKEEAEKEEAEKEKAEKEKEEKQKKQTRREKLKKVVINACDLEEFAEDINEQLRNKPSQRQVEEAIDEPLSSLNSKFTSYFKELEELVDHLKDRVKNQEKKAEQQEETIQELWSEIKELRQALKNKKDEAKPEDKTKSIQPMTKLNFAKYTKEMDWKEWKKDFEFEALIGTWSEPQKLSNLMYYLSDEIRKNCKQMTKEQIQNYDEVIKLLEANYGNVKKKTRLEYEREFLNLAMNPNTPVNNFMLSIKETAKLAEISDDSRIVERFTEGLRPKEVLSATRRECKEKGFKSSEDVLNVALEEQKKYLEEKQLLDHDERRIEPNKVKKCKTCETKLEKNEFLFCKSCKESHQKEKGDKQRKNELKKPEDREREAEILKNKPHLALKHEELRAQDRCFYCAEKLADHSTRSCRDKYPDLRPYQVRDRLKKGIDVPESKNDSNQTLPRASGS